MRVRILVQQQQILLPNEGAHVRGLWPAQSSRDHLLFVLRVVVVLVRVLVVLLTPIRPPLTL